MSDRKRRCSRIGCENFLSTRQKRFCSNTCSATWRHEQRHALEDSVAIAAVQAEVVPVVREALTGKVLRELQVLTELIPEAVAALQDALTAVDAEGAVDTRERRQAAELILRYTIGNRSVAPAPVVEEAAAGINIHFGGIPQQGDPTPESADGSVLELPDVEVLDERICLECDETKLASQFVGESDRCQLCHDKMLAEIADRFPGVIGSRGA